MKTPFKTKKHKTDLAYRRSLKGVLTHIRCRQLQRSKKYGYKVTYSLVELHAMYLENKRYQSLHRVWAESGYDRWLKPSFDRVDPYGDYSLENMELMTWQENWEKGKSEWPEKNSKRVLIESGFTGEIVFESMKEAAEYIGCSKGALSAVASGARKSIKGFTVKKLSPLVKLTASGRASRLKKVKG